MGDLKNLLDQAAERDTTFVPDVTELVTAGRRRERVHRLMMTGVTAAAVVIAAVLVGQLNTTRAEPQPATTPPQPAPITDLCARSDNFLGTANNKAYRLQVIKWSDVLVGDSDADGSMVVRRSPDGSEVAYCVAGVPIQGEPVGGFGSTLLNTGIITRPYQIQQYRSSACGDKPIAPRDYLRCQGTRYSYAGRVPEGVTRIEFSGLGQEADATVNDGYWTHRIYTADSTNRNTDPVYITMFDASGKQVFRVKY
jgi:hypothetical protein